MIDDYDVNLSLEKQKDVEFIKNELTNFINNYDIDQQTKDVALKIIKQKIFLYKLNKIININEKKKVVKKVKVKEV